MDRRKSKSKTKETKTKPPSTQSSNSQEAPAAQAEVPGLPPPVGEPPTVSEPKVEANKTEEAPKERMEEPKTTPLPSQSQRESMRRQLDIRAPDLLSNSGVNVTAGRYSAIKVGDTVYEVWMPDTRELIPVYNIFAGLNFPHPRYVGPHSVNKFTSNQRQQLFYFPDLVFGDTDIVGDRVRHLLAASFLKILPLVGILRMKNKDEGVQIEDMVKLPGPELNASFMPVSDMLLAVGIGNYQERVLFRLRTLQGANGAIPGYDMLVEDNPLNTLCDQYMTLINGLSTPIALMDFSLNGPYADLLQSRAFDTSTELPYMRYLPPDMILEAMYDFENFSPKLKQWRADQLAIIGRSVFTRVLSTKENTAASMRSYVQYRATVSNKIGQTISDVSSADPDKALISLVTSYFTSSLIRIETPTNENTSIVSEDDALTLALGLLTVPFDKRDSPGYYSDLIMAGLAKMPLSTMVRAGNNQLFQQIIQNANQPSDYDAVIYMAFYVPQGYGLVVAPNGITRTHITGNLLPGLPAPSYYANNYYANNGAAINLILQRTHALLQGNYTNRLFAQHMALYYNAIKAIPNVHNHQIRLFEAMAGSTLAYVAGTPPVNRYLAPPPNIPRIPISVASRELAAGPFKITEIEPQLLSNSGSLVLGPVLVEQSLRELLRVYYTLLAAFSVNGVLIQNVTSNSVFKMAVPMVDKAVGDWISDMMQISSARYAIPYSFWLTQTPLAGFYNQVLQSTLTMMTPYLFDIAYYQPSLTRLNGMVVPEISRPRLAEIAAASITARNLTRLPAVNYLQSYTLRIEGPWIVKPEFTTLDGFSFGGAEIDALYDKDQVPGVPKTIGYAPDNNLSQETLARKVVKLKAGWYPVMYSAAGARVDRVYQYDPLRPLTQFSVRLNIFYSPIFTIIPPLLAETYAGTLKAVSGVETVSVSYGVIDFALLPK